MTTLRHETLQRLCRARERLRESLEHSLSIGDVARETRMSRYHFIRRFVALFGETPHQYRIRARLDRARHLLAAGRHSVTEVCMEVGFSSLGSFDFPVGECRWITVVSPEGSQDIELALEPNANPSARAFQEAMFAQGIPIAAFEVADLDREVRRLKSHGVVFTREPTNAGLVTIAIVADTCGNLIQLYQPTA